MKKIFNLFLVVLFCLSTFLSYAQVQVTNSGYYRIRNQKTNRYMDIIHNVGEYSYSFPVSVNVDFHSLYLLNEGDEITEPGSIIYVEKKASGNSYDFIAQGTSLYKMTNKYVTLTLSDSSLNSYLANVTVVIKVYFQDDSGFDYASSGGDPTTTWFAHRIGNNMSDETYFGVAPKSSDCITIDGTKYYFTTLRTSFNYNLSDNVEAFYVKKSGNEYSLEQISGTVPANMPVILRCKSTDPSINRLFPTGVPSTNVAVPSLQNNSSLVSPSDYNFFKYREPNCQVAHRWSGKDYSGKYGTICSSSNANYKVLSVKDGKLGFFDKFTDISSDPCLNGELAYMNTTEDIILLADEADLKTIAGEGSENHTYQVTPNLYGVKVVDGKLYAKDNNNYAVPSTIANGQVDYMQRAGMPAANTYDQSNWVALNVANPESYVYKDLQVMGTLLRKPNPEMNVIKITAQDPEQSGYNPNIYIPASFMGNTQTSTVGNQETFFFVTPKPQEYAHITWAVYGGNNIFYVAAPEGSVNQGALKGGFKADDSMMPSGSSMSSFTVGNTYEFDAIIQRSTASKATPYTGGGYSNDYVVYPLSTPSVITAVNDVNATKTVSGIKYYNLAGMASDVPFDGVNIRVTTFSDGSNQATKVIY